MHESESHDKSQPLGESKKRSIFARFFKRRGLELEPLTYTSSESNPDESPYEQIAVEDEKPTHSNPAIAKIEQAEAHQILSGAGVETSPNHTHVIHYVGGINLDSKPDLNQTFKDYVQEHDIKDSQEVASIYTGTFSKQDNAIILKLVDYYGRSMTDEERQEEFSKLSQGAREFMEEVVIPEHLHYDKVLELIQKDNLVPVAYYHNLNLHGDLREDEKIFFWIDDTFGGEITLNVGPMYNDQLAGPTADGEVNVSLRGKLAGQLYWNTWHSNAVRWSVDPFLRSTVLAENPDNQIYAQL